MLNRVYVLVFPARLTQNLQRAIRDHLVRVHVGRGAGAALNHIAHKLLVPFALDDLVARFLNCTAHFRRECAQVPVGLRCGKFHHGERANQVRVLPNPQTGNRKILQGAQCVDAPIGISRHFAIA